MRGNCSTGVGDGLGVGVRGSAAAGLGEAVTAAVAAAASSWTMTRGNGRSGLCSCRAMTSAWLQASVVKRMTVATNPTDIRADNDSFICHPFGAESVSATGKAFDGTLRRSGATPWACRG